MTDHHDEDPTGGLEEELRRRSAEVEAEQLEREISGNLTPEDEEMIDLREERLRREALENAHFASLAVVFIERAQALERAAGRTPDEGMTLGEALEVLKAHGEDVPEFGTDPS